MDKFLFYLQKHNIFAGGDLYIFFKTPIARQWRTFCIIFLINIFSINLVVAQEMKLSLTLSNSTLETIFKEIEKQTGYKFVFNTTEINPKEIISVDQKNRELSTVLNAIFRDRSISYRIANKHIALFKQRIKKVTGVIVDNNGETVIGANVIVKGTTNGTVTDLDGRFSLDAPDDAILHVTYIGYNPQEVAIKGKNILSIQLIEDTQKLDEVVVVGYGTVKKSDLTGSVSSIKSDELKQLPLTSLDQGIQGRAAGVQVTNTSGAPGGAVSIRVRGGNSLMSSNEPMYVVDGFPLNGGGMANGYNNSSLANNPLATINPSDIESIEILKDASATAVYGSRGANGVVLITTKRGKSGKTKVSYEGYAGVQSVAKKLDMMTAEEYAILTNEGAVNEGKAILYGGVDSRWKEPSYYRDNYVDWQDMIFRSAITHNHQLSVNGGNEITQFAVSGNYFSQDGTVVGSNFNRGSLRANVDTKISSWVKVSASLNATRTFSHLTSSEGDGGGSGSGVINGAIVYAPTMPMYNDEGAYTTLSIAPYTAAIGNPYATAVSMKDHSTIDRVLANIDVNFDLKMITKGLSLTIRGGTDYTNAFRDTYFPSTVLVGESKNGVASKGYSRSTSYLNENLLTYQNTFGKHSINVLAGLTVQTFTGSGGKTTNYGFVNDVLEDNNMGTASNVDGTPSSWRNANTQASWLGRINYNFGNRYLVTLTGRADGSSKFGVNNKWGFFPSAALAWRVTEEAFMQDIKWITNLKARVSYGATGNQNLSNYQSLSSLSQYSYSFGNIKATGFAPNKIPNPDLKWETTTTLDAGFDVGFLKNRLNVTFDYYDKQTTDLLWNVTIPQSSGFSTIFKNHGSLSNWGIEAAVSYNLIANSKPGAFTWTTSLMYSMNRNKVKSMPGINPGRTGNLSGHLKIDGSWLEEGYPVGVWKNYVYEGVFQNQEQLNATIVNVEGKTVPKHPKSVNSDGLGSPRFKDVNQDGILDKNDWVIIGDPNPDFIASWNNTFTYKNFDLSIFINGVFGNDILDLTRAESCTSTPFSQQRKEMLDRWTPQNANSDIPAARLAMHANLVQSSYMIQDGSFVRLKNVVLGYRIPVKKGIESLRVYVSGQNLFTITGYKGFDPEVNSKGQNNLQLGVDYNAYPMSRIFTLGMNITL